MASEARLHPPFLSPFRREEAWAQPQAEVDDDELASDEPPRRRGWRSLLHPFVWVVVLPTLLTAAFEYLVAADQYESSAQFIVRTPQPTESLNSLGQMLGVAGNATNSDVHSVDAYLLSHDAVDALGRPRLITIFRRPEADPATRLWFADPQPETLHKYYRGQVDILTATDTGITTLSVRSFRPEDAKALASDLLKLGERRVNLLNQRMFDAGLASATRQVREAETLVEAAQNELTAFRQTRRDVSPDQTGLAQIQLVTTLQQQTAQARAQLESMAAVLPPSAPQYSATARRLAALERQVGTAKARLAGPGDSLAGGLGEYEGLQMRQQLAAKQFEAAQAGFQSAREQLLKQQLFIVPVVEPNLPGKALHPKRLSIIAIVLFGLMFAYAIGWLILAGVREHAE
ncbi:capsular polysaccharide transport system permease protein [Hephaestia caeni]|uniref:Capsular polysaccharide transport system permease protein n=1 Tax=Hephaestia caeni TaxID=645617 RepID=A0A397PBG8_9SPHN|nr:capsule biosynthesis protein [Hephaestia caeni]RIA46298.1 capsular polysaccharide transport system permease protein [Hephaestia caeni]